MKNKIESFKNWLINNSLWIAGFGLMIASSGIDGAYMIKFNAWKEIGGYALNTTSDIVGMILMYWFGVFRQSQNETKRKMAFGLIPAELVAVIWSWLFSWRQMRPLLKIIETDPIWGANEIEWLAFVFAGFVPLLLAFIGYAQSLQIGTEQSEMSTSRHADIQNQLDVLQAKVEYLQWPIAVIQDARRLLKTANGSKPRYTSDKKGLSNLEKLFSKHKLRMPANDRGARGWLDKFQKGIL